MADVGGFAPVYPPGWTPSLRPGYDVSDLMPHSLTVEVPYEVPCMLNARGTKHITADDGRCFFDEHEELADRRGCYLFAIRSGRGLRAAYVGLASRRFSSEVFAVDKLQKFNTAMHQWDHGTPLLLFVVTPPRVRSLALIRDVEQWLIREAQRAWPDLLNKHHTGADNWEIPGITIAHRGRLSEPERELGRLLDLPPPE